MLNQFALYRTRRFFPYFSCQFLGAFNDNLFKNILILLLVFHSGLASAEADLYINLAAGLFILPFFLFSGLGGLLADKYPTAWLIRRIKLLEVAIMALAAVGILLQQIVWLLPVLFAMGIQSALFGPIKYSLLPKYLKSDELIAGNAQVQMGTFIAIILGSLLAGVLVADNRALWISALAVVMFALVGWWSSRFVPDLVQAESPQLSTRNPLRANWLSISALYRQPKLFKTALAVSWFWFMGAAYLTQLPAFTLRVLQANEIVVSSLLALFCVGVALGAILCGWLSRTQIRWQLSPLGGALLSVFSFDLVSCYQIAPMAELQSLSQFVASEGSWRVMLDLLLVGMAGGLFIVPLQTMLQKHASNQQRASVIAANNILNSLLMVGSAICGIVLLGMLGWSIPWFIGAIALVNLLVCLGVFRYLVAWGDLNH